MIIESKTPHIYDMKAISDRLHLNEDERKTVEDALNYLSDSSLMTQLYIKFARLTGFVNTGEEELNTLLARKIEVIVKDSLFPQIAKNSGCSEADLAQYDPMIEQLSREAAKLITVCYVSFRLLTKGSDYSPISYTSWISNNFGTLTVDNAIEATEKIFLNRISKK